MLHRFINICASVATNHVPTRKRHSHSGNRIPRERRNLMRRSRRITEQLRKTTSEARRKKLKTEAKEIEKKVQKSYRQSQEHSENKAVSAIKKNVKFFYGYRNSVQSKQVLDPSLMQHRISYHVHRR